MEMSKSDLCKQRIAERNEKIVALHATGMLTKDIAKEVHASESTTCNILKKAGLSSHGALKNGTRQERFAAIRGQHAQGLTNIKIAEVVGLSPATVGQYVREMGLIRTIFSCAQRPMPRLRALGHTGIACQSMRRPARRCGLPSTHIPARGALTKQSRMNCVIAPTSRKCSSA